MRLGGVDLQRELNRLEEILLDSPRVPLSRRTLINEEQFLEQLDLVRLNLPSAFQEAAEIVVHKEDILQEAEQYAQEIIAAAEQRAAQILNDMGLVRQAEMEATQIRQQVQQGGRVVIDDRVGQKPRTFVPDLLFRLGLNAKFPAVHVSHRTAQTVIGFPAIEHFLHVLAQLHVINELQDMEGTTDVLQFPKGFLGLVLPLIAGQFAHNGGLRYILLSQRGQDALEIGPFAHDPRRVDLMCWTDQPFLVLAGCLESHQGVHFLVQVAIPRSEPIAKDME